MFRNFTHPPGLLAIVASAGMAFVGLLGCEATFTPRPVGVVYDSGDVTWADSVPSDIYQYPTAPYEGTNAYLYGGRWYVPSPRGWMVVVREPTELSRTRTRIRSREVYPSYPSQYPYSYPSPTERRYRPY